MVPQFLGSVFLVEVLRSRGLSLVLAGGLLALSPPLGGLVAQSLGWSAMLAMGTVTAIGALVALHRLTEPQAQASMSR